MKTLFGTYITGKKVQVDTANTEKDTVYEMVLKYRILPDILVEKLAPIVIRAVDKFKGDIQVKFIGIDTTNNKLIIQFKDMQSPVPLKTIQFAITAALAGIGIFVTLEAIYKITSVATGGAASGFLDLKTIIIIIIILMLLSRR